MAEVVVSPQPISLKALRDEVRRIEPRAFLVPLRILRRVIRADGNLGGLSLSIPHRKGWVLSRDRAIELLAPDELGLTRTSDFPDTVLLLIRPDLERLEHLSREQVLQRYWRLLFHARIHVAFDEVELSNSDIQSRIHEIGEQEFDEIRNVLNEERFLLPDASDRAILGEFTAVFLELLYFAPHAIRAYFPAIASHHRIVELIRQDIDDVTILQSTRLSGVELPAVLVHDEYEPDEDLEDPLGWEIPIEIVSEAHWRRLMARAERELERGNTVRAAILRARAARFAPTLERAKTHSLAIAALDAFVRRLRIALNFNDRQTGDWKRALRPLLENGARGIWPREARLLYTLQKICAEKDREVYTIDLFGWATSFGKKPLKRPLPHHRETRLVLHLRDADKMLLKVRLAELDRQRLGRLIDHALDESEDRLRSILRPIIIETLDQTGVVPRTAVERAARRKLVEELLEKIVESGFLRFGNLRDDLSRNQIKLPDLSGPVEFFEGDRLLRTDKALANSLDGVYRRGEVYMRWLQRFSSLLFGTTVGRALTCYVILPLGGAFVILEGLTHLINLFVHMANGVEPELMNPFTLAVLALVILAAVNSKPYRAALWAATKRVGRGIAFLLFDIPRAIINSPVIIRLMASRAVRKVWKWLVKPGLVWLCLWLAPPVHWAFAWLAHRAPFSGSFLSTHSWATGLLCFGLLAILLNSRAGRDGQEIFTEGFASFIRRLRVDFFSGMVKFVEQISDLLLEHFERLLYAVDERLRFRSDQNRVVLIAKGIIGMFWGVITYFVRIYVNLLIEPQINPIKHFPVVTVSHKVILPMTPQLYLILRTPFLPLGLVAANAIGVATVFLLPGVFGFLVWEFKENWKLYEANRAKTLGSEMVGHHGETLQGFLRPGFHSGTIPRAYARWRKAERKAQRRARPALARRPRESLFHLEHKIHHFVERAMLYLLDESHAMGGRKVEVTGVQLATNRITVELSECRGPVNPARILLDERAGVLSARVSPRGWLDTLDVAALPVLEVSLAGLFVMSEVEVLGEGTPHDFSKVDISWSEWSSTWQQDCEGRGHPDFLAHVCTLLPAPPPGLDGQSEKKA